MANPPNRLNTLSRNVTGTGNSGSAVEFEPFDHLIQHIKQVDVRLYEALKRGSRYFVQLQDIVNKSGTGGAIAGPFIRTLDLKNTTVGNDIADHVPIFVAGKAVRLIGVLRRTITSNLTVRVNANGVALVTMTTPSSTPVDEPQLVTAFTPSAALADLVILTFDVVASDGLEDENGVASYTLQWGPA